MASDYIRGLFKSKVAIGCNFAMIGDSINDQYQSWSVVGTMAKLFQYPCLGASSGLIASTGSGWPTYNGEPNGAVFTTRRIRRPGDPFADGSDGHNLRRTYEFSTGLLGVNLALYANPVPQLYFGTYENAAAGGAWEAAWDSGYNMQATVVARSTTSPNSPADWSIQTHNRSGALTFDEPFNLRQSPAVRYFQSSVFARGTGGVSPVAFYVDAGTEDESTMQAQLLSLGLRCTNKTSGVFWSYIGNGSWTTKCHSSSTGELVTADSPSYQARYSDEALVAEIKAFGLNCFGIWLGQNSAADEWDGASIKQYKTNILAVIARYRAACATAGVSSPVFVLFSSYDASDTNAKWVQMAQALLEVAQANDDCEYVDIRGYVQDTLGNTTARLATYPGDPVHPDNSSFRTYIVNRAYTVLNGVPNASSASSASRNSRATRWFSREIR